MFLTFFNILMYLIFFSMLIFIYLNIKYGRTNTKNYIFIEDEKDEKTLQVSEKFIDTKDYNLLFKYFISGFLKYSSNDYSNVNYPGVVSLSGNSVNQLEGVARTLPLFGAWIYSGRKKIIYIDNIQVDLIAIIRSSIVNGTNPKSKSYWGDIDDYSQKVLEASDIVKVLWMTKKDIWDHLSDAEKFNITEWLKKATVVKVVQNNWIFAPFLIELFLKDVDYLNGEPNYKPYFEFKENYLESGWFRDGKNGEVDYYNTWGIPYDYFWVLLISGGFDKDYIIDKLSKCSHLTSHLISPQGIPFMGRSMCYRTAIPSPILMDYILKPNQESTAKRALDSTWLYFVKNKALNSGTLTLGYHDNDFDFVNLYTGSGSSHWGLRSLILAFMIPETDLFWHDNSSKLPVEKGDFILELNKMGWIIQGDKASGNITLTIPNNYRKIPKIEGFNFKKYIKHIVLNRPYRKENHDISYHRYKYYSNDPLSKK